MLLAFKYGSIKKSPHLIWAKCILCNCLLNVAFKNHLFMCGFLCFLIYLPFRITNTWFSLKEAFRLKTI